MQAFNILETVAVLSGLQRGRSLDCDLAEQSRRIAVATNQQPKGIYVDHRTLASGFVTRDLTVGTATAGGHIVATNLLASSFIEMLRNRSVTLAAGITVIGGLVGNVAIPRQTGGATAYWVAESGAPTESQQAFDQVPMSPHTIGAYTDVSRKLVLQATPAVETIVRSDLTASIGLAIDDAILNGTGAGNQPTGLLSTSGLSTIDAGSAAPTWAHIVDLETQVTSATNDDGNHAYALSPATAGKLRQTFTNATYGERPILEGRADAATMNGRPCVISNQVPDGTIVFGNWSDIVLGLWGALDLTVDPYTFSSSGGIRIVALQDVDVCVRHIESFAAVNNLAV